MGYRSDMDSATGLVDNMIGSAYPVVREVASNLEYVKHVSAHLEKVVNVSDNMDNINTLVPELADIDFVVSEIEPITNVGENISSVIAVSDNMVTILNIETNIPNIIQSVEDTAASEAAAAASATNSQASAVASAASAQASAIAGASGVFWKAPVRAATAVAGTLASSFENGDTIDGVVLATGDRILIKNQVAGAENGIYTVNASGAPTRATDVDTEAELLRAAMAVIEGTTNLGTQWTLTTVAPIVVGTTALTFLKISDYSAATAEMVTARGGEVTLDTRLDAIDASYYRGKHNPVSMLSVTDAALLKAMYVHASGQVRFAAVKVRELNDHIRPLPQIALGKKLYGGRYLDHSLFSATLGQSLGQGNSGGGNETMTQRGRSYAYRVQYDIPSYLNDRFVAVATSEEVGMNPTYLRGESPMFGFLGHTYEMLQTERGLAVSDHGMYRVGANNAAGSTIISQHVKGQASYLRTLAQITQEKAWGAANGVPVICPGQLWLQGEGNNGHTKAYYLDLLAKMAIDYAADIRLILDGTDDITSSQTFDPHIFTYATCGRPLDLVYQSSVPRAQLQAAVDYFRGTIQPGRSKPAPVILTCPTYFMGYPTDITGIHVPAQWSYMLGAYGALAIQRMMIDEWDDADPAHAMNLRWPPIHPISVRIIGGTVLIKYKMRLPGVKLEWGIETVARGEGVAEQENYGFAVYNTGSTTYKTIVPPRLVAPDTVEIKLASGSFVDGDRIGYAMDVPCKNWAFFTGNAGNLRDNHGDFHRCEAMNIPMHNFVSPHFITLDASTAGWTLS